MSLVDRERSKLKQGKFKSDIKENSLMQLSRFFLSQSILQFSSPQTTLTPAERMCMGLKIHCDFYPGKQVANYMLRNLCHNTLIPSTCSQSSCFPAALATCSQPHACAQCPFSCVTTMVAELQYCEMSQLQNNLGFGGFKRAITWEYAKSAYCKASDPI